jgi:hypothetical protein
MESSHCTPELAAHCEPATCHWRCALEVIDELLAAPHSVTGEDVDHLLDLRWQLRRRSDAEAVLRLFCDLRLQMERRHYLAFFRIRRWLENNVVAAVQLCPAAKADMVPLKLDRFCVEAIRRSAICNTLRSGKVLLAPRVQFVFQPAPVRELTEEVARLAAVV